MNYEEQWEALKRWTLRERELLAANEAQSLVINAVIYRMSQAEAGNPDAFNTI